MEALLAHNVLRRRTSCEDTSRCIVVTELIFCLFVSNSALDATVL